MPASPRTTTPASSGPLLGALRRWWWLPLLGALLGAALGLSAGSRTTYTATALVQSRVMGNEAQAVAQGAQAALANLQTPTVFAQAAKARSIDARDLTDRTRAAVVGDSAVLSIAVEAPTRTQAVADANAVANAAVAVYNARVKADMAEVQAKFTQQLKSGSLAALPKGTKDIQNPASLVNNGQAELARQSAIGQALGESQSAMITGQGRIRVIEAAGEPSVTRDMSKAIAAMSMLGGLFLGAALALVLGMRRGSVRSVHQLRSLYPGVSVVPAAELDELLDVDLPRRHRVLVVGGEGSALAATVQAHPAAAGHQIVRTSPGSALVDRLGHDDETLVLVDVPAGTRIGELDAIGHGAGPATVLVTAL